MLEPPPPAASSPSCAGQTDSNRQPIVLHAQRKSWSDQAQAQLTLADGPLYGLSRTLPLPREAWQHAPITSVVRILSCFCLIFLLVPFAEWATRPLSPGDVFWQVRAGELALDSGVVPATEPFSYTVPGVPWNNHEWAWEYAVALLQRSFGWGGIRVLVLVLVALVALPLGARVFRRAGPVASLYVLVLFGLLCRYKMMPVPQLPSLAIFLCASDAFRGRKLACSPARFAWLFVVLLLWGNLTAESLMFLPFLLIEQLSLRLTPGPSLPPLRKHLIWLAAVCVAPLINPPWSSSLEYVFAGTSINREVNSEFASIFAPATTVTPFAKTCAIALMVAFVLFALLRVWREKERGIVLHEVLPGLFLVLMAAMFERNLWLMLLPTTRMCVWAFDRAEAPGARRWVEAGTLALSVSLFSGLAAALNWSPTASLSKLTSQHFRAQHLNVRRFPMSCIAALGPDAKGANIYTLRLWSNYLIWALPESKVFVDGRNREYPLRLHEAALHIWAGAPEAIGLLMASNTDYVIAAPGWGELPNIRSGPFKLRFQDASCALYQRSPAPASEAAE